jgi:hypothetical protein
MNQTWPCALIDDSFLAIAISFITEGATTEPLRVTRSTPVELECMAELTGYFKRSFLLGHIF